MNQVISGVAPGDANRIPPQNGDSTPLHWSVHSGRVDPRGVELVVGVPDLSGWAALKVYDVQGRNVATLYEGLVERGWQRFMWGYQGSRGPIASGVYFVRLHVGEASVTEKVVVVR
jgi:hypothetical protein